MIRFIQAFFLSLLWIVSIADTATITLSPVGGSGAYNTFPAALAACNANDTLLAIEGPTHYHVTEAQGVDHAITILSTNHDTILSTDGINFFWCGANRITFRNWYIYQPPVTATANYIIWSDYDSLRMISCEVVQDTEGRGSSGYTLRGVAIVHSTGVEIENRGHYFENCYFFGVHFAGAYTLETERLGTNIKIINSSIVAGSCAFNSNDTFIDVNILASYAENSMILGNSYFENVVFDGRGAGLEYLTTDVNNSDACVNNTFVRCIFTGITHEAIVPDRAQNWYFDRCSFFNNSVGFNIYIHSRTGVAAVNKMIFYRCFMENNTNGIINVVDNASNVSDSIIFRKCIFTQGASFNMPRATGSRIDSCMSPEAIYVDAGSPTVADTLIQNVKIQIRDTTYLSYWKKSAELANRGWGPKQKIAGFIKDSSVTTSSISVPCSLTVDFWRDPVDRDSSKIFLQTATDTASTLTIRDSTALIRAGAIDTVVATGLSASTKYFYRLLSRSSSATGTLRDTTLWRSATTSTPPTIWLWNADSIDHANMESALHSNTVLDSTVFHSGAASMRVHAIGNDGGNQQVGADVYGIEVGPITTGKEYYNKFWMNIDGGFGWGTNRACKASRVTRTNEGASPWTGYLLADGFGIGETEYLPESWEAGGVKVLFNIDSMSGLGWHEYIVYEKMQNGIADSSGEFQLYVDGQLKGSVQHIRWINSADSMLIAWRGWMVKPYFQLNGSSSDGGDIWLDDFEISNSWNSDTLPSQGSVSSFTMTNANDGNGTFTPATGSYDSLSWFTITAIPTTGYRFHRWTRTANVLIADTAANPTTAALTGNGTITLYDTIVSYTVTYNGNGSTGGAVPTDGNSPYDSNTAVTVLGNTGFLTRTGHTWSNWNTAENGSGTDYSATDQFNIAANTTLYAEWTINQHTIDTIIVNRGAVTVSGGLTQNYGTSVTVNITPGTDSMCTVSGDTSGVFTSFTFTLNEDKSFTFTFDAIPDETPATITADPAPVTDTVGRSDTMFVTATGAAPIVYQWQSLTGTTVANLTVETNDSLIWTLTRADSGTSRRCIVSNAFGEDTSAWALVRALYRQTVCDSIRPNPQYRSDSCSLYARGLASTGGGMRVIATNDTVEVYDKTISGKWDFYTEATWTRGWKYLEVWNDHATKDTISLYIAIPRKTY